MNAKEIYLLKKEICKIGYLFGCVPGLVLLGLGVLIMSLFDWVRYEVTK